MAYYGTQLDRVAANLHCSAMMIDFPDCNLRDDNVFRFAKIHFAGLELFCDLVGRLATSMIMSTHWVKLFINVTALIHLDPATFRLSDSELAADVERVRRLLRGGFVVARDTYITDNNFSAYVQRGSRKRVIYLNEKLVCRLTDHSFGPNGTAEKRRWAAITVACLLVHDAAHWLHAFARPSHFYKDASVGKMKTLSRSTPPTKLKKFGGVRFNDFGRIMESLYYGGAVTIRTAKCPLTGLDMDGAIDGINIIIQKERKPGMTAQAAVVYVPITKEPSNCFRAATYADDAEGFVFAEAITKAEEMYPPVAASTASATSTPDTASAGDDDEVDRNTQQIGKRKRSGTTTSTMDGSDSGNDDIDRHVVRFYDCKGKVVSKGGIQ